MAKQGLPKSYKIISTVAALTAIITGTLFLYGQITSHVIIHPWLAVLLFLCGLKFTVMPIMIHKENNQKKGGQNAISCDAD